MNLHPDDPRLTAYALGELPADEARTLESDLQESPEARAAVEETRALAALLAEGLAAEAGTAPDPRLTRALEEHLQAAPEPAPEPAPEQLVPFPRRSLSRGLWIGGALAACLALAAFLIPPWLRSRTGPENTQLAAVRERPEPRATLERRPAPETAPTAPAAAPVALPAPAPASATPPAPAPAPTAPAPAQAGAVPVSGPTPELMKRYGLAPNPAPAPAPARGPTPAVAFAPASADRSPLSDAEATPAAAPSAMSSDLRDRYGLSPGPVPVSAAPPATSATRKTAASAPVRTLARSEPESRFRVAPQPAPSPGFQRPLSDEAERRPNENPGYVDVGENPFRRALDEPLSTFGLDVDTGSYANVRRFLNAGQRPPPEAVRIEELLNYFRYDVPAARGDEAFRVATEVAACPWAPEHRLVRLTLQARGLEGPRPPGNFVFLVDVSGSMAPEERLPLLKQALKALVRRLAPADRIAIVTYASTAGVHLPSTSGEDKETILAAIDALGAGGSTNGEGGIRSAYEVASAHFHRGGVNRVLLCTDGDFNVGLSNQNDLVRLIEQQARSGIFLTTLGVGTDNFKDALMRRLADRGNGSYHYLDSFEEAQRVLIREMDATFVTVARDAKAQVEFNPGRVGAWRLLGYEKRLLAHQDFNDDTKDAGEIGAGHQVTVLYEILPPGTALPAGTDPLKYQRAPEPARPARELVPSPDLFTLKIRYQRPEGSPSTLLEFPVRDDERAWTRASADFRFAAAVASFGMVLRDSPHRGRATLDSVLELGRSGLGPDPDGWRAEFLALVRKAKSLAR